MRIAAQMSALNAKITNFASGSELPEDFLP
jgi:hypothetical protein